MVDSRPRSAEQLPDSLTEREHEILVCLAEGLSNREVAQRLYLAETTIRWYNSQIYSKLGVGSREEAVDRARVLGLLDAPSAPAPSADKHNLPAQATLFVGRAHELNEIAALLDDTDAHLITILAPGGMGKTRLALEVARMQLGRYADGVFFVPLAPLSSAADLVPAIAENIGFSFHGERTQAQQLTDFLHERSLLLVLDNFEHLLDSAPLVSDLIQTSPGLRFLVTSRERLSLRGETVYTLKGLGFPALETPAHTLDYDAVKLFMQSALRLRPDYRLSPDELDALARICRLTAGMPLGLELAAGWIDVLSLEQIAAELQQGIDLLETEMRDVPERQRSIRATFDRTWDYLRDEEKHVFMRLSAFRGSFTREAAQLVANGDIRFLHSLTNKALIQVSPQGRHEVHELLRQYGAEKLAASGDREQVRQVHSVYFLNFLTERDEDIKGRRQQTALQEIRAELENVRAAWQWAVEQQQYQRFHRSVLDCLVNFGEMCSLLVEAQTLMQQTSLLQSSDPESAVVRDQAAVRNERLNGMLSKPIDHVLVEALLQRNRQQGDEAEIAYCLWVLGDHTNWSADYEASETYFAECLVLRRKLGDDFYLAHTLVGIAWVYYAGHRQAQSLECAYECIRIRRQRGDRNNLCLILSALAWQIQGYGQFTAAEQLLDEALAIQEEIGPTSIYTGTRAMKAVLAFWRGEFDSARLHAQAGLDFAVGQDYVTSRNTAQAVLSYIL